jgi:predicted phage terminase large subunit-like protein
MARLEDRLGRLEGRRRSNNLSGGSLSPEEIAAKKAAETCFAEFVKQAWEVLEPRPLKWAPYLDLVCSELEALSRGEFRNLMILMPPGSAKSLLVSVLWPAWEWISHPEHRYITASYAMSLATRDARRTRELIQSQWYQRRWGDRFSLSSDQNMKSRYQNDRGGHRLAVSPESATTGERGDTLIYDDPSQLGDAFYPSELEKASRFFAVTLTSRGVGDATRRVLAAQRIHVDDVPGRVLEREGADWRVCLMPMRSDPTLRIQAGDHYYGQHPRDERAPGELLNPHLASEQHIRKLEISFGTRAAAILQQAPTREQGAVFRRKWLRYFIADNFNGELSYASERLEDEEMRIYPVGLCARIVTVDLASSLDERADFTVYQAWAISPNAELFLVDQLRERLPGDRHLSELRAFCNRHRPQRVLIESVGFQQAFVQQAAAEGLPVVEKKRTKGQHKQLRAIPLAQMFSEGRVYLPIGEGWLPDFEGELLGFPYAPHDDVVDAAADAAEVVAQRNYVWPTDPTYKPVGKGYRTIGPFSPIRPENPFETPYGTMPFGGYGGRSADNGWGLGPAGGGSPEADDWEPPPDW